jgi:hypothetical protein
MSSCNYSNLPSVVELRAVRGRDEYRWKKMGALLSANVFFIPFHFVSSFPILSFETPALLYLSVHLLITIH